MLFLYLFHSIDDSFAFFVILLGIEEHPGFDDPHGLGDYADKKT